MSHSLRDTHHRLFALIPEAATPKALEIIYEAAKRRLDHSLAVRARLETKVQATLALSVALLSWLKWTEGGRAFAVSAAVLLVAASAYCLWLLTPRRAFTVAEKHVFNTEVLGIPEGQGQVEEHLKNLSALTWASADDNHDQNERYAKHIRVPFLLIVSAIIVGQASAAAQQWHHDQEARATRAACADDAVH